MKAVNATGFGNVKEEHPVWEVLQKEKYVEESYGKIEEQYDFIKSLVTMCGNVTKDGNTVPAMKVFFDMWDEYSHETFRSLDSLVNAGGIVE